MAGGFSTGTEFHKALAAALQAKEATVREEIEYIKAFILNNTGFRVTNIQLIEDNELTIKAIRKGSDK